MFQSKKQRRKARKGFIKRCIYDIEGARVESSRRVQREEARAKEASKWD